MSSEEAVVERRKEREASVDCDCAVLKKTERSLVQYQILSPTRCLLDLKADPASLARDG